MRGFTLLLLLICLMLGAETARADKRVAFVVGNGAYRHAISLSNPPADAKAMAEVLRNVGFDVVEGTNLAHDQMTELLRQFGSKAKGADVAVFFYAGHGLAIRGTTYLLPVDADIRSEMDVRRGAAIDADLTLDRTLRQAKVRLVFLDACRDNPFATAIKPSSAPDLVNMPSGFASATSRKGTLISFATGPGQTALEGPDGAHSPFTRALVDYIAQPGADIRQAMTEVRAEVNEQTNRRQLPRGQTSLIGPLYLNPVPAAALNTSGAAAVSTSASDAEIEFWRSIKQANKPAELNAYLGAYPDGRFTSLARARLAVLEHGPLTVTRNLSGGPDPATFTADANQVTEDQIGLSRAKRRDVQRRLTRLGFDTKVNGKFDPSTRAVITRWQAARGYPATGFLNTLQHKALLAEIVPARQTSANEDSDAKPARHHRGGGRRHHGGGPLSGPGRFIGGVVGGLFR